MAHVVVAAIDFSPSSALALDAAIRTAVDHPGAELHVVHVASGYGPMLRLELEHDVRTVSASEAEAVVASHVKQRVQEHKTAGLPLESTPVSVHLRVGAASDEVVAAAAKLDADLIVVGTHGRTGVRRLLLGSVAEAIVRKAGCGVLVVRAKDYAEAEA